MAVAVTSGAHHSAPAGVEDLAGPVELRVLDVVGLRPQIDRCVACGGDQLDRPGQVFDARRGGVVCAACHGHGHALDGAARRALARAQSTSLAEAGALHLSPTVNADCREVLTALVCDHLGHALRSLEFIAKLNGTSL
jgi:DNA repair protein RecO (recombination protein O)